MPLLLIPASAVLAAVLVNGVVLGKGSPAVPIVIQPRLAAIRVMSQGEPHSKDASKHTTSQSHSNLRIFLF